MSNMGSITAPPSTPECRSGKSLVICTERISRLLASNCRAPHPDLEATMHDPTEAVGDARRILRDPCRVTDENSVHVPDRVLYILMRRWSGFIIWWLLTR